MVRQLQGEVRSQRLFLRSFVLIAGAAFLDRWLPVTFAFAFTRVAIYIVFHFCFNFCKVYIIFLVMHYIFYYYNFCFSNFPLYPAHSRVGRGTMGTSCNNIYYSPIGNGTHNRRVYSQTLGLLHHDSLTLSVILHLIMK